MSSSNTSNFTPRDRKYPLGLLTIVFPPMAVAVKNGTSFRDNQVLLTFLLTLCFWIPGKSSLIGTKILISLGVIYSAFVCFGRNLQDVRASDFSVTISKPEPIHSVPRFLYSFPTSPSSVVITEGSPDATDPFKPTQYIV